MKLKNIYNKINNCLDKLYDYEDYSGHIELVKEMSKCIDLLSGFFGIRILRMDIGPFKKDEMVWIIQDESGAWIQAIDNNRTMDLLSYLKSTVDDWFYPMPNDDSDK